MASHIFIILTKIPSCPCALLAFKDLMILRISLLSNLIEVRLAAELYVILSGKKKKNFMAPFYGWGSTASRLVPLRGGSLPQFTTFYHEVPRYF